MKATIHHLAVISRTGLATFLMIIFSALGLLAQSAPEKPPGRTVVFLHGLFQNPDSWSGWINVFEAAGYVCHAPAYPYHGGRPDSLRADIAPGLARLTYRETMDSLTAFIDRLPVKPVLVGHSMGGLAAQQLIEQGKATAAVAIAPAPPRGVSVLNWRFIKSNFRMVNPLKRRDKACLPPMHWFRYTFFNTLDEAKAQAAFDRYFVPESRLIARGSTMKGERIDFKKPHRPLLFIAGGRDNDLPPALIRKNHRAYQDTASVRTYKEFPGRSHYICGEEGWEEVAGFVLAWLENTAKPFTEAAPGPVGR